MSLELNDVCIFHGFSEFANLSSMLWICMLWDISCHGVFIVSATESRQAH